jgi:hypothetical protein
MKWGLFLLYFSSSAVLAQWAPTPPMLSPPPSEKGHPTALSGKNFEVKKNKAGLYEINWILLGSLDTKTRKPTKNLKKILNKKVKISGFIIPIEMSKKTIDEFLLLAFMGCAHMMPSDSQAIHVVMNKKSKAKLVTDKILRLPEGGFKIEVEGVLRLITDKDNVGYKLEAQKARIQMP